MSIPKVVGIEQEYAIKIQRAEKLSAFDVSCMLVNAYARDLGLRHRDVTINWDYGHETPYQDIRGDLFGKRVGQQIVRETENRLINAGLPNGARLYTDHAHPEYSTPECLGARDALACDKAGEVVLRKGLTLLKAMLPLRTSLSTKTTPTTRDTVTGVTKITSWQPNPTRHTWSITLRKP